MAPTLFEKKSRPVDKTPFGCSIVVENRPMHILLIIVILMLAFPLFARAVGSVLSVMFWLDHRGDCRCHGRCTLALTEVVLPSATAPPSIAATIIARNCFSKGAPIVAFGKGNRDHDRPTIPFTIPTLCG